MSKGRRSRQRSFQLIQQRGDRVRGAPNKLALCIRMSSPATVPQLTDTLTAAYYLLRVLPFQMPAL